MVVAATGFFDGVHLGHKAVLRRLKQEALRLGMPSAVVTFWPHPRKVLQKDADSLSLLNSIEEKRELVLGLGVDYFYVVPFTLEFSKLDTARFMKEYLVEQFHVDTLVIGYDHRLGHSSTATREELEGIATQVGLNTCLVEEVQCGERKISSTQIRKCLNDGNVAEAAEMLGYFYSLSGVVTEGNRIGRTIGFPTANLQLGEPLKLIPADGVYAVKARAEGHQYKGVCNIGTRPTVAVGRTRTIETYLFGYEGNLYGKELTIELVDYLREERRFESLEDLRQQMLKDAESAEKVLAEQS